MKQIKKILALALTIICILSFAACKATPKPTETPGPAPTESPERALEIYKEAVERMKANTALHLTMNINLTMDMGGIKYTVPTTVEEWIKNISSEDLKCKVVTTTEVFGESMKTETYYTNGFSLVDMFGTKYKQPMSYNEFSASQGFSLFDINYDEKIISEITMEKVDGSTTLNIVLKAESLLELPSFKESLESLLSEDEDEDEDVKLSISNATLSITLDEKGDIASETIKMDMAVSAYGINITYNIEGETKIIETGDVVDFEIPSVDEYPGYEESE